MWGGDRPHFTPEHGYQGGPGARVGRTACGLGVEQGLRAGQGEDKAALVKEVAQALYASKICSYAQGHDC